MIIILKGEFMELMYIEIHNVCCKIYQQIQIRTNYKKEIENKKR